MAIKNVRNRANCCVMILLKMGGYRGDLNIGVSAVIVNESILIE